ncbi:MAG: 6-carboxytetrahydropterin synthase QueD [Candidatus Omnitrophica bacterium]|nr:6-carboxytetrahydropterin synthase QueD [Candidatus Omnitrophota bacterium]
MFELTIIENISTAHFLREYEGKCKNLHGHIWKIKATVSGNKLDKIGMVADFALLKDKLHGILEGIDHVCLNDLEFFKRHNPTSENLAKYVYDNYKKIIAPLKLKEVQVFESDTAGVTYYE